MHNNVDALPRVPLRHVAEGPTTPARGEDMELWVVVDDLISLNDPPPVDCDALGQTMFSPAYMTQLYEDVSSRGRNGVRYGVPDGGERNGSNGRAAAQGDEEGRWFCSPQQGIAVGRRAVPQGSWIFWRMYMLFSTFKPGNWLESGRTARKRE